MSAPVVTGSAHKSALQATGELEKSISALESAVDSLGQALEPYIVQSPEDPPLAGDPPRASQAWFRINQAREVVDRLAERIVRMVTEAEL